MLADGRSLLALKDPERAVLAAAVTNDGLGVLTLADDAVLPAAGAATSEAEKSPAAALLPWTLRPVNGGPGDEPAAENADRSVRLRWPGMPLSVNASAEAAPWEIALRPIQTPLIRDAQGRAVAAAARQGRGNLALTLVRETGRWNRTADPAAFAAYWSHLFSQLARRDDAAGRWSLADGDTGPMRVDEPLELVWQGTSATSFPRAVVTDAAGADAHLAVHPGCDGAGPLADDVLAAPSRLAPDHWRSRAKRRRSV